MKNIIIILLIVEIKGLNSHCISQSKIWKNILYLAEDLALHEIIPNFAIYYEDPEIGMRIGKTEVYRMKQKNV